MGAPAEPEARQSGPDCFRCRHFVVSHARDFPYLCRAFEMKTRVLPSLEVLRASGRPCAGFDAKPPPAHRERKSS